MNFKATNWFERNYKWLSAVLIGLFTAYGICYYINLSDKSDTFIASLIYALLLFLAGIYLNYMSNTIESKIDDRIDIYRNLLLARSFLKNDDERNDLERVLNRIAWFQISTGRSKKHQENDPRPIISERGIRFDASDLVIEKEFETAYDDVRSRIISFLHMYLQENDIQIKTSDISISSLSSFKPDLWCKENLEDYSKHGRKMVAFIYKQMEAERFDIEALEFLGQKVMNLYDNFLYQTNKNINQIERMYGGKLQYKMLQQNELQENFRFVMERIYEVEDRLSGSIDEHDVKMESYVSEINDVLIATNDLRNQIADLQDSIENNLIAKLEDNYPNS